MSHAKDSTSVLIPDIKNGDVGEAAYVLRALKVNSNSQTVPSVNYPVWGTATHSATFAELKMRKPAEKKVPSVIGMGAKDAVYLLESLGLRVRLHGVGQVKSQSISSGAALHKGQTILLTLN